MKLYPILLAGGSGTRLWPLSRRLWPKQFLNLFGERSLLQETACRVNGLSLKGCDVEDPIVVCNTEQRFFVEEQITSLGKKPSSIICEPIARNTAPALTLAAHFIDRLSREKKDSLLLAMPVDITVKDLPAFERAIETGVSAAEQGYLVTFGIPPTQPSTAYGYIKTGVLVNKGVMSVDCFVEKPNSDVAKTLFNNGAYLWNSGVYLLKVSVWLELIEQWCPSISRSCRAAVEGGQQQGDFFYPDANTFNQCPSKSIDYAVTEHIGDPPPNGEAFQAAVVSLNAGWSDLGSWNTVWEESPKDSNGNVLSGAVYTVSTRDSLLMANHRLLASIGLQDVLVVETADAVLVASRNYAQQVKQLVELLKSDGRPEHDNHRVERRPWGSFCVIDEGPGFLVKRLSVKPGAATSLQFHNQRTEHWTVVNGVATVNKGVETLVLNGNESIIIPAQTPHRLANEKDTVLEVVEVQIGTYLSEDDIVRFEDKYGRAST